MQVEQDKVVKYCIIIILLILYIGYKYEYPTPCPNTFLHDINPENWF